MDVTVQSAPRIYCDTAGVLWEAHFQCGERSMRLPRDAFGVAS